VNLAIGLFHDCMPRWEWVPKRKKAKKKLRGMIRANIELELSCFDDDRVKTSASDIYAINQYETQDQRRERDEKHTRHDVNDKSDFITWKSLPIFRLDEESREKRGQLSRAWWINYLRVPYAPHIRKNQSTSLVGIFASHKLSLLYSWQLKMIKEVRSGPGQSDVYRNERDRRTIKNVNHDIQERIEFTDTPQLLRFSWDTI
jgi:hypothetical protein